MLNDLKEFAIKIMNSIVPHRPYFQLIYYKSGGVYGFELFMKNGSAVPSDAEDLAAFTKALNAVMECLPIIRENNLKVHLNLFPKTINCLNDDLIPDEIRPYFVVEVVEKGENPLIKRAIEKLHSLSIPVFIDDFGTGSNNLNLLSLLKDGDGVKIDVEEISSWPMWVAFLKEEKKDLFVIAEKVELSSISFLQLEPIDAIQTFSLHRPELLTPDSLQKALIPSISEVRESRN
jgi:hypothetical protein